MNISFENPDKVNGLMTITVEEADFKDNVDKMLKDYRKRANFPGFRPGMVPLSLVKRQYGLSAKMDAVNRVVSEELYKYIKDNDIKMLGEPLPSEKQVEVDLSKEGPYSFVFDIAVAPEFKIELNGKNKIDYYTIKVDDQLIDQQADMYASRAGSYEKAEEYNPEERDMLKGDLRELDAEGNTLEGGITLSDVVLMPQYIKVDEEKAHFDGAKLGDIITFNPRKAYPENDAEVSSLLKIKKEEIAQHEGDFSYQITEISRYKKHAIDQELFDQIYGEGTVKSEEEFRSRIADEIRPQLQQNSDYKFMLDVRAYVEKKIGKLTWPDEILKRVMLRANEDKGMDYVEKNYEGSIKELTWHLAKEQLVAAHNVKLEDGDVKAVAIESARTQFAQYGMSNVPTEYLENYANDLLKKRENIDGFVDRAIENKLREALKKAVKLNEKEVTLDEFNAMMRG
ncbi:MAG: trigger factor [Prevotella sp.]|nr:trigger factor [Prevotella sp.]